MVVEVKGATEEERRLKVAGHLPARKWQKR